MKKKGYFSKAKTKACGRYGEKPAQQKRGFVEIHDTI